MALADYTLFLDDQVDPPIIVLLIQIGITFLYAKQQGTEKLDIIVGEVD